MVQKVSREGFRFGALIALSIVLLASTAVLASQGRLDAAAIQAFVAKGGIWSPILYVFVAALLHIAWVPRAVLTAAAAALFGFTLGAVLGLAGGLLGAMIGYAMGKRLGHPYLDRKAGARGRLVLAFIARHGFLAIVLGRVNPAMSCELVSLCGGLAAVPMRRYVPASVVGMLPGSILYAAFGASIVAEDAGWVMATSIAGFVVLSVVTGVWLWALWKRDLRQKRADSETVAVAVGRGDGFAVGPDSVSAADRHRH